MNARHENFDMADDMGQFAELHFGRVGRLTEAELSKAISDRTLPRLNRIPRLPVQPAEVQPTEAASAVSGIGFENEPAPPLPRCAYLLAPAFDRWPRATTWVVLIVLLALWGFAGQLDLDAAADLAR